MRKVSLLEICETGLKEVLKLGADEAEVYVFLSKDIEVKIQKNDIHVASTQVANGAGIRVFKNKGLGFAGITDFKNIKDGCKRAVELASVSPKDEYNKLPFPMELKEVPALYDPRAEEFGVEQTLKYGINLLREAKDYDPRITVDRGSFEASIYNRAIMNSNGIKAEKKESIFIYYIMGMAVDGSAVSSFQYEVDGVRFVNEIDIKMCAHEFAKKAVESLGATKGESFRGKVILSPDAVEELIAYPIIYSVNANNVQKGMSKWKAQLDTLVASEELTIEDNGLLPGGLGSSTFDREGIPHSPITIMEAGRLCSYMYNTYTATKDNRNTTGHASGGALQLPWIGVTNLIMKEGKITKDELIKGVNQGVLVTRFSGFPNPMSGEFSGVVKGGWLIKNGELTIPLCETLIQGNIYELLHKVFGVSKEQKKAMNFMLPWVGLEGVSVTAG